MDLLSRRIGNALCACLLVAVATSFMASSSAQAALFYVSSVSTSTIYAIDSATNSVVASIPATNDTTSVAVSSDGSRAVVLEVGDTAGVIHVINTATNIDSPIKIGAYAFSLALSADGKTAYVAFGLNGTPPHLSIIDIGSKAVVQDVALPAQQNGLPFLALSADGKKLFLVDTSTTVLLVFDTTTLATLASVTVPYAYYAVAASPSQPIAYAGGLGGNFSVVNANSYVAQAATQFDNLDIDSIAVTADGKSILLGQYGKVLIVNAATNALSGTMQLPSGSTADGIALSSDGKTAYVADTGNGQVIVLDTTSLTVITTISVPGAYNIATNALPYTPSTVPFAKYTPEFLVAPKLSAYSVAASFSLTATAPAISPTTQSLTLTVDGYSVILPAGSIKRPNPRVNLYTYSGTVNGADFGLILTGNGTGPWGIVAVGSHSFGTLPATTPVTLTIGPDSGTASVKPISGAQVQSLK
jgi:YVTN family beta-propeller protein